MENRLYVSFIAGEVDENIDDPVVKEIMETFHFIPFLTENKIVVIIRKHPELRFADIVVSEYYSISFSTEDETIKSLGYICTRFSNNVYEVYSIIRMQEKYRAEMFSEAFSLYVKEVINKLQEKIQTLDGIVQALKI